MAAERAVQAAEAEAQVGAANHQQESQKVGVAASVTVDPFFWKQDTPPKASVPVEDFPGGSPKIRRSSITPPASPQTSDDEEEIRFVSPFA